jgi:hypothetical protein
MPLATNFLCVFQENEVRNYSKESILIRNFSSLVGPLLVCPYASQKTDEYLILSNSPYP